MCLKQAITKQPTSQQTEMNSVNQYRINQELSLFIPHVFPNFTEDYIENIFESYGDIDHVDFVSKIDKLGKQYNSVYIHFYKWFNTKEVEEFQKSVEDPDNPPRIYHDAPWFWIIFKNNAKKYVPGERKERINIKDTAVRPCVAEKEFYERDDNDSVPDLIPGERNILNLSVDFEGETLMEFALRSELKKLKKEVERLNTLLQESEDNAKKQLEDNVKLYGEVERLTFEKEELQEKADRSSGQLETAERSVARYQNLSKDYYKLLDEKDDLEEEKADLEAHIMNQEVMINDKDTQIRNLQKFIQEEQISKRELVVEYMTLKSEKIELLDENDDLKEDRKQLTEDNDNLKEDNDRLEEENDRLKEEKADLEASVDALHEEQELMQLLVEDLSNQIKATNPTQDHSESLSYYIIQREDMIDRIVDTIQNSMDLQTAKETVGRIYQNPEYYPVASYLKDEDSQPDADMSYEEFVEDQEVFAGYSG